MSQIVQCVPNISEGKQIEIINKIIEPLQNHDGFKLVSVEPDQDYNRTVITLIGDPQAMIEPLLLLFKKAIDLIDMKKHQGEHSRMGAVDVVPFIPISGIDMQDCIAYANQLAQDVAKRYNIPVYLYAQAAMHPSRVNLPEIRKGEFEGMHEKMKDDFWKPDFGPSSVHPSFGVVAIGARSPLIAYNIDLNTKDEKIARFIARTIRQSSGGFQYVQAGPVYLEDKGHVQVTMNILDFKKNPMYRIFETVKMEALRYHVDVTGSEIVGLIPKEALLDAVKYDDAVNHRVFDAKMTLEQVKEKSINYLKLRDFDISKMIEAHV